MASVSLRMQINGIMMYARVPAQCGREMFELIPFDYTLDVAIGRNCISVAYSAKLSREFFKGLCCDFHLENGFLIQSGKSEKIIYLFLL